MWKVKFYWECCRVSGAWYRNWDECWGCVSRGSWENLLEREKSESEKRSRVATTLENPQKNCTTKVPLSPSLGTRH